MKSKPMLAVAGAVGGTVLATAGVSAFLLSGDDGGTSARPAASARAYGDTKEIAAALQGQGTVGCRIDRTRVECRFGGRYVAGTVLSSGAGSGLTMDTALESWKTGVGQSALGEQGAFAILHGPNWLVTGPDTLIDKVRPALGGRVLHCDHPFGACA